ncbi:MAG: hypothetical protein RQ936_04825 [Gammaproteobacteria bacterium]|nr:hypothetical protein [Gammaproteobacteria bacterium]
MNFTPARQLLMMTALMVLPLGAQAATATAQVSVNIVPITSFAISGSALFSGPRNEPGDKSTVHLDTSGIDNTVRLKIHSDSSHFYDVSVSLPTNSDDEFYRELKIVDSQLTLGQGRPIEKGVHELEVGGAIEMENSPVDQSQSGYVYIITNFN